MNTLHHWRIYIGKGADTPLAATLKAPLPPKLSLDGVLTPGRDFDTPDCLIDLNTLATPGEHFSPMTDAIVATVVRCVEPRHIRLGVGVDWWVDVLVNGALVGSTFPDGNGSGVFNCWNNIFEADLKEGDNVIACHVRSGGCSWSFAVAELPEMPMPPSPSLYQKLYLAKTERLSCPPFLQAMEGGKIALSVKLNTPGAATLDWREEGAAEWIHVEPPLASWQLPASDFHRFPLDGASPGRRYECRVTVFDTFMRNAETLPALQFQLPEPAESHTAFLTADLQWAEDERKRVLNAFLDNEEASNAQLFCTLGDMDNNSYDIRHGYFDVLLKTALGKFAKPPVWLPIRGNHEMVGDEASLWETYIGPCFYFFRYADTVYLALDTAEEKIPEYDSTFYSRRTRPEALFAAQKTWLKNVVSSEAFRTARHRIVFSHGTPFEQDSGPSGSLQHFMAQNIESVVGEFFYGPNAPFKPDLWLCGHTHRFTRFTPQDQRFSAFPGHDHFLTPNEHDRYHFPIIVLDGTGGIGPRDGSGALLKISPDAIEFTARQTDGTIIDHFIIRDGSPLEVLETALVQQ